MTNSAIPFNITNSNVQISNEVFERTCSKRDFEDSVGVFASVITVLNDCTLYPLDDYDKSIVKDIKLKDTERIFRYDSKNTRGIYKILIKINLAKGLVYYLTEEAFDGDEEIKFETRGVKVNFLKLSESVI
jgi:hypothetical protein